MGFGEADLPRAAGMLDRGDRAGAGTALETGDCHMVGMRLRDAGSNGSDTQFRY